MDYSESRLADYTDDAGIGRGSIDVPFLLLTLILLCIGVVMVLSASFARAFYDPNTKTATYYFTRQLTFAVIGVAAMMAASMFPIGLYRRFSGVVLLSSVVLLLLVLVAGTDANGARRWFTIASITFQPSEIAKIAVVLFDAQLICRFKGDMGSFKKGVVPFVLVAGVIVGLLVLEPHYSASFIIIGLTAIMMFLGGTRLMWFLMGGGAVVGLGALVLLTTGYTSSRISTWMDPFGADASNEAYQIIQSLYAIGSGGLSGLGLGNGRQKYLYLPEEHNDFIFSVICEELGFIGATLILVLFALLIIRGFYLALHCKDRYSFLVCAGLTSLLAIQVILNIAVVTNLIPCTGISLPFFSYGGTALLLQLGEMGIILSISRDIPEKKFIKRKDKRKSGKTIKTGAEG